MTRVYKTGARTLPQVPSNIQMGALTAERRLAIVYHIDRSGTACEDTTLSVLAVPDGALTIKPPNGRST